MIWTFDQPPAAVAIAAAITAGILLLVTVIAAVARHRLRDAARTPGDVDDFLLDMVQRTRIALIIIPAVYAGSRVLTLPRDAASLLSTLTRLSLIAQGVLWAIAILDFALGRYHRRRHEGDPAALTTIRAFRFAALIGVWSIALLVALDNVGVDVTALVTGLGIGGVAIALAVQNILGDLFASLSIVLDKPFVVGDFIRSGDHLGVVERIGLKTTRVRSLSGEQLIISNTDLLQSRIQNFKRMAERRVVFTIRVAHQTRPEQLERIPAMVRSIVERAGQVRFDRVHFASMGESSFDFECVYFVLTPDYSAFMDVQHRVNLEIVRAFEREEIRLAQPARTVVIQDRTALSSRAGVAQLVE